MKIIDNKKDYYDYLAGIYGIDTHVVYDRRGSESFKGTNAQYTYNDLFKGRINQWFIYIGTQFYHIKRDDNGEYHIVHKSEALERSITSETKAPIVLIDTR